MIGLTPLLNVLNQLGGRQAGPAASADLARSAPHHLPLVVCHCDHVTHRVTVRAVNVQALLDEHDGDELHVYETLTQVVAHGRFDVGAGDWTESWITADPKGVARQAVQWALDSGDAEFATRAFMLARPVLDQL